MGAPAEHIERDRGFLIAHITEDYHCLQQAREKGADVLEKEFERTMNESLQELFDLGKLVTRSTIEIQ
jgi:hypothetical protein